MNGKSKCKILKEIRRRIAEENDIAYVTSECKHQGNCLGTCPKCEAEVRYLEEQLEARKRAGRAVALTGLALTVTTATASCITVPQQKVETTASEETTGSKEVTVDTTLATEDSEIGPTAGVPVIEETDMGEVAIPELEVLFTYAREERNNYITMFHRENIRIAWNEYLESESETEDYFEIFHNGTLYLITVAYAANGMAQSIEIISDSVPTGAVDEIETDIMGDITVPLDTESVDPTEEVSSQIPDTVSEQITE